MRERRLGRGPAAEGWARVVRVYPGPLGSA